LFGHPGGDLLTTADVHLPKDVCDVVVYRALGDEELLGDLLVGETLCYQGRDLSLAAGELARWFVDWWFPRRGRRVSVELLFRGLVLGVLTLVFGVYALVDEAISLITALKTSDRAREGGFA
jgi:hypothetical protein